MSGRALTDARSRPAPPVIKWTGSKRSQAHHIFKQFPPYNRYFEPFVGSGALLYLAARPGTVAGDIYEPLIELWCLIQTDVEVVIHDYAQQWRRLQQDLPAYFYQVRDRFNLKPNPLDLLFLTRTCVNGITRFNYRGQFNNSFHLSRRGLVPERFASIAEAWHRAIQGVAFVCQDYAETLAEASAGDFVYLDPPYAGNKQRYAKNLDAERFFAVLESLNRRGVRWALSFDGKRGLQDYTHPVPKELYKQHVLVTSGNSAVGKVLNAVVEVVDESLYMNY